ncbi:sensor histidine kinase [Sphingomonas baiyangensis]|uniref:histidine kinase n=1 Tax=Sphingomonas baiyangensis TaxID=2572576 RepID=A0A4U1L2Q9_9SPHN|nr:sensor histidine kinase [Sphingomonas baiyangensis]TKD51149.1 histidine kinase [Sphingomonas baiyangensis]
MTSEPTDTARPATGLRMHILVGLLALGLLALASAVGVAIWAQQRAAQNGARVEHTLAVQELIQRVATYSERVETARRGYLLSAEPRFLAVFDRSATVLPAALARLETLTRDNPAQRRRVAALRQLDDVRTADLVRTVALVRSGQRAVAMTGFASDPATDATFRTRAIAAEMLAEERRLLAARNAEQQRSLWVLNAVFALVAVLLLAVVAGVAMILLRYTRALSATGRQLARLNSDLEGVVSERTAELQRANAEIQRFAYIVSHDLRSPLVNVMGFTAELDAARKTIADHLAKEFERDPDSRSPEVMLAVEEDLPEAIGFIRTSTQKMDRLINAILRLSREGRRRLTPEPLAMRALVGDIAATLHQRAADAGATIEVGDMPDIVSDRVAIEQILSNLVENAIKYGKPGRPTIVRVEGRRIGTRIAYDVIDNGRGIEPRDHERIFELFRRSGAQDRPGEGIGLAHVRALAYRLGGLIEVTSTLDEGSTFRLSLPHTLTQTE